jgi:hypothetical protein
VFGHSFIAEIREQKQRSCQASFARVEELIDQVRFNAQRARKQLLHEQL